MASTSYQTDSLSVPASFSSSLWDVFLSFRGEDTRNNFTGHLYTALVRVGVRAFMDDPELPRGEKISSVLVKAIQESKVSIVVFSKNYASSTWCLEELVKILECKKTTGRLVLPVFYHVSPSDVRHQRGSFQEAFEKDKKSSVNTVGKWRATLTEAANLSGYHLDANGHEANLIQEIVGKVQREIEPKRLYVAQHPVGVESRVEDISPWLSMGNNDVRRIGIYGMVGVGKTTIAKDLYNKNFMHFQGSCFLMNVQNVSGQSRGLVFLQELLLCEVLKTKHVTISSVERGISLIEERLSNKKVLIVLDDLYHINQSDSLAGQWNQFAPGSRIIITTRDERLLDQIQVDYRYKVEQLDDDESLELFSRHAFRKPIPLEDFVELSKGILRYAGGIPLALEVLGIDLFNRSVIEWKSYMKKLQQTPQHEIQEKLIISFDALDDNLKNIFLDIACFFIGVDKDEAVNILNACNFFSEIDISILTNRCLVKIDQTNKLWMHVLLRDMGRYIVHKRSQKEGGMQSHLWSYRDIGNLLKTQEGTEAIECIIPASFSTWPQSLNTKTFEKMCKLRLLQINYVHLSGSFEHIFQELRWLCWNGCPLKCLPLDFHPEKLVILDMQQSKIKILWEGIKILQNLKTLNLSCSSFLTTTPDFTGLPRLERLLLQNCERLTDVHPSIGLLHMLVYLDLENCKNLRNFLPSNTCNMRSLEELNLGCCYRLEGLPEQLGNMVSLRKLCASQSAVKKLPNSIGHLSELVELNLSVCKNLTNLPDSIGRLSKLVALDISNCENLVNLPSSICNLRSLESLNLYFCRNLQGLPEELGNMVCLRNLDASHTSIKKLPCSIELLKGLCRLRCYSYENIFGSQIGFIRPTISGLCSLQDLWLHDCGLIDEDIVGIGSLSCLKKLSLSGNYICSLPSSFTQLLNLKALDLSYCKRLQSLSELPPNLECLYAYRCETMEKLPNLSKSKQLKYLYLLRCSSLAGIQGLEDLCSVKHDDLEDCNNLATFEELLFPNEYGFGKEIAIVLPRWKIPDWFGHKGHSISVNLPSNFLQLAIWVVCGDEWTSRCKGFKVVAKNETRTTRWTYTHVVRIRGCSFMMFMPKSFSMESGDRIQISFLLFDWDGKIIEFPTQGFHPAEVFGVHPVCNRGEQKTVPKTNQIAPIKPHQRFRRIWRF